MLCEDRRRPRDGAIRQAQLVRLKAKAGQRHSGPDGGPYEGDTNKSGAPRSKQITKDGLPPEASDSAQIEQYRQNP